MSDSEPEKALEAIEQTLGRENLLKLQNLLLKGIVKKNFSSTSSPPKNEESKKDAKKQVQEEIQVSPVNPENSIQIQKRPPKRKLNELEKLQQDINEMYDREAVYRSSLQGRTCAKRTDERVSEILEKERDSEPNVTTRSRDSKPKVIEETVYPTCVLKGLSILAVKLNVTEEDMPIIFNNTIDENYINLHINELKARENMIEVEESSSEEYVKDVKEERIEPSFKPPTATRSVAKKRIRNNWAKGFIRKTKRAKPTKEWEDVEKEKPELECEAKMKLGKFSKHMQRVGKMLERKKNYGDIDSDLSSDLQDYMDESFDGEWCDDVMNDSGENEKNIPKSAMELQCDEYLDVLNETDNNLLDELPSQELLNSFETQKETETSLVSAQATISSPVETFPEIKQEKVTPAIPSPIKVSSPPPLKLLKLSPCPPQAIIKPIQQTTEEERKIFEFKKIKIPPNPIQNNLIRIEPKTKTAAPLTIRLKDISTLKVYPLAKSSPFPLKTTPVILTQTSTSSSSSTTGKPLLYTMSRVEQPVLPRMEPTTSIALPRLELKPTVSVTNTVSSTSKSIVLPPQLGGTKVPVILPQTLSGSLNINNIETEDILRPWISDSGFKCTKQKSTCMKMINQHCLAALFKCMGTTCCFFTNDKHLFQIHVELHFKLQPKDLRNCLVCAYCPYLGASIVGLIKHIESEHRYYVLSCNQCFYRSFNEYQLYLNHYPKYHEGAERVGIVLDNQIKKPAKSDLVFIKNMLTSNVAAFTCICKRI